MSDTTPLADMLSHIIKMLKETASTINIELHNLLFVRILFNGKYVSESKLNQAVNSVFVSEACAITCVPVCNLGNNARLVLDCALYKDLT
jgi:hypothetical protein